MAAEVVVKNCMNTEMSFFDNQLESISPESTKVADAFLDGG